MSKRYFQLWPVLPILLCTQVASANTDSYYTVTSNAENGLVSWTLQQENLKLELEQRLPDQTRGFFLARTFTAEISDQIGQSCVFKTVGGNNNKNPDAEAVTIDLNDWRIRWGKQLSGIKLKEDWLDEWQHHDVSEEAKIAFRWATFPTYQVFEYGDYNWGMISFGLPPGESFDLQVVWRQNNVQHSSWIHGIQCPRDR